MRGSLPAIQLHCWPALPTKAAALVQVCLPAALALAAQLRPPAQLVASAAEGGDAGQPTIGNPATGNPATGSPTHGNGKPATVDASVEGEADGEGTSARMAGESERDVGGSERHGESGGGSGGGGRGGSGGVLAPGAAISCAEVSCATVQLFLPLVELHVHTARPKLAGAQADLLRISTRALTLCVDAGAALGLDCDAYLGSLRVRDARSHVPDQRSELVHLKAAEATPDFKPELDIALTAVRPSPAAPHPSTAARRHPWRLSRDSIRPLAVKRVQQQPLLRATLPPPPSPSGLLSVSLVSACTSVGVQWNPMLGARLVDYAVSFVVAAASSGPTLFTPTRAHFTLTQPTSH